MDSKRQFTLDPDYISRENDKRFERARRSREESRHKLRDKNSRLGEYNDENQIFYASLIMTEEYITKNDLLRDVFVMPRPLGQRCLLVTKKGKSYLYSQSGFLIKIFDSDLPVDDLNEESVILDGYYVEESDVIYVQDMQL